MSSTAGGEVVALEVGDAAARAAVDAERAARDAGLTVRAAESVSDLQALIAVGEDIWGPNGTLAINEMRAVAVAGGVLLGAYDLAAETKGPVGFLVGFLGWNGGLHVHSHQTGVLTGRSGGGVGYALKLAQREVCLRHGIDEVRWTFDPLVRRNTSFNLRRLGARAEQFLPDCYGPMSDSVNNNDLSDRLEAVWHLSYPLPADGSSPDHAASGGPMDSARPAALVATDDWPQEMGLPPSAGDHVAIPVHFARMRQQDPACARAWRLAVRRVLTAAYASGLEIGQVDDDGYVLAAVPGG